MSAVRVDETGYPAIKYKTGKYYTTPGTTPTTAAPTQSRLRVVRWTVEELSSWDRIGTEVTTGAGSSTLRWCVYSDAAGVPGVSLLDTGAVGDSTSTGFKEATIALTLQRGVYWVGVVAQGGNPTLRSHSNVNQGAGVTTAEIVSLLGVAMGPYQDSVTAAVPSPFVAAGTGASAPMVWLRKA